jgi:hypothetical protein
MQVCALRTAVAVALTILACRSTGASSFQSSPAPKTSSQHSVDFWREIAAADYVPPASADVPELTAELCEMLASSDPEVRDTIAYSTLTSWIYQKRLLDAAALRSLTTLLLGNLRPGIGTVGSDAVLRRSFSALTLSVVVARDNADPILAEASFRELLDGALTYLLAEKDVRGFDDAKGWIHSAAHTADLLKFLARSRYLTRADQTRLLDAITRKLQESPVFTFGEDERLARAALSIVNRTDFDRDAFSRSMAAARPTAARGRTTSRDLQGAQNVKNFLAKFVVLLSLDPQPSDSIRAARESVANALKDLF